ncbi:MAG: efflux RND transporter permease subunit [Cellvibrionales bacterium]|jgi:multidrug efflux pump|nr:efflux RND transporter permease subunit [Cellvibrionales bacterium]MBK8675237.1 efflux RND transporter permease subunit [Cellvibrionales bacterium]
MNTFLNFIIDRSRTTLSLLVLLMIVGIYSYRHLPVEVTPNIATPYVSTTVVLEGVSPQDGVRLLIKPMEVELRSIDGVKEITARAMENMVNVVIEFNNDINTDAAIADVRAAVDRARGEFPDDAKEPIIKEITSDEFPAIVLSLVGKNAQERVLYNNAQSLKRKIQTIPNVLEAKLVGHREEVLEAVIDRNKLETYGISGSELINAVNANNLLVPAGEVDTGLGRFSVKLPGLIENYQDLYNLPLRATSDGVIKLGDVADVRRTFKDASTITRVDGKPAISIEVNKRAGANMIEVANAVRALIAAEQKHLPAGIELVTTFDQTPFSLQMVSELQGNILAALVLVLVVVVAALGTRSALLVSLGVPVASLGGIAVIYFLGYSFNFMVLFGLLLAIGMIVDGAIVIAEYADCKMADGLSPREAYIAASVRMFAPATASMLTTLCAFLPLMFWPGIDGAFMRILPVTVFAVLAWSITFALVFLPVLGALFGKAELDEKSIQELRTLEHDDPRKLGGVTGLYARLIEQVLRRPILSIVFSLFSLFAIFVAYEHLSVGTVYFTESETEHGEVNVSARGNLSAQESAALVTEVENIVRNIGGVVSVYTSAYPPGTAQGRRNASEDEIGHMLVTLESTHTRKRSADEIFWEVREKTAHLSGIRIFADKLKGGPPVAKDIQIEMRSDNQEILQVEAARIREHLEKNIKDLVDIDDTMPLPGIEWEIQVDRQQAALYGASVGLAGLSVQLITNGVLVGKYRPDDAENEVDIRVRYPVKERNIEALDALTVTTQQGAVPLSNFVDRVAKPRVNKLQRLNGSGVVSVYANAALGVLPNDKISEIRHWLETDAKLNPQVTWRFRGAKENEEKSVQFLGIAFLLAMLLMLAMMVAQFNSFYQTFLVLSSVVMSTAGVLLGHMIFRQPFSIILGGVGIVALAGVIVHNNIILLDTYNHLRRSQPELSLIELAVRTGAQRLRPVCLTVITAGLGLVPLALGISIDLVSRDITTRGMVANYWKPLAASLVYGLTFATVLTLVITPMLMIIPERLKQWWQERKSP